MFGGRGIDDGDGGWGDDILSGGPGGDFTLSGGPSGIDLVIGGDGDDACLATIDGTGNDEIGGGPGMDRFYKTRG